MDCNKILQYDIIVSDDVEETKKKIEQFLDSLNTVKEFNLVDEFDVED